MAHETTCLYSTVKNTSGGRMKFAFLPPHGQDLAANEEFTIFGDVQTSVIRNGRNGARRNIQALETSMANGWLQIIQTPAPILESPDGTVKMISLRDGGVLTTADPCWTSST